LRHAGLRPRDVGQRRVQCDGAVHLRAYPGAGAVPDVPPSLVLRNTPMTMTISRTTTRATRWVTPLALAALLTGCDLEVINPGPIQATNLDQVAALNAIV